VKETQIETDRTAMPHIRPDKNKELFIRAEK
jgi:hypothetical protein